MTTIETISPRVSIVKDLGIISVRVEHLQNYTAMIRCGAAGLDESLETAQRVARLEAWKLSVYDWEERAHKAVLDANRDTCEACPYRNRGGCLSKKCPVFRLLDCVNKAPDLVKRTSRSM